MITIIFYGEAVSFNEYIEAERKHRIIGAKLKKQETETMAYNMNVDGVQPIKVPINLTYKIFAKNKRRDPDSWNFWEKCFLDSLQCKEVDKEPIEPIISNDGQDQIKKRTFLPIQVDAKNPRIEIIIENY